MDRIDWKALARESTPIDYSRAAEYWLNDDTLSPVKMGDRVIFEGLRYTVKGVNRIDDNAFEYALTGYNYLVYDYEVTKV